MIYDKWVFFYEGAAWVYGAFILMVLVGQFFLKIISVKNFLLSSLTVVFLHWFITDLGVFLGTTMYPKTLDGFLICMMAAIPFEQNFLSGTLLYGGLMFFSYEWLKKRYFNYHKLET